MPIRLARGRAFTLIELLVVVAIIAVLISILLPSLARAREQGKMAKCLANLRSIMLTTHTYFVENNDSFPYLTTKSGICSWSYGGKTSDPWWKHSSYGGADFWTESRLKPFNRIMRGGNPLEGDTYVGGNLERRVEYPEYQCPSDNVSTQRIFSRPPGTPPLEMSAYDDVGVSYHFNIYFFTDTNKGNTFKAWEELQRAGVRESRSGISGRFVMFWEDPMDLALSQLIQRMGFHKVFSRHSVGFLDGHAANALIDSRSFGGPGWLAINPNWVKRPTVSPAIFYRPIVGGYSKRNDEPPP